MGAGGIWVVCETIRGGISEASLALVAKAKSMCGAGGEVVAVLYAEPAGAGVAGMAGLALRLGRAGASRIIVLEGEIPMERVAAGEVADDAYYAALLARAAALETPTVVLMSASAFGRAVMPRAAAALRTGLTADCSGLEMRPDGVLVQTRPAYGSNLLAQVLCPSARPQMATTLPGAFPAAPVPRHPFRADGRTHDPPAPGIIQMRFDVPDSGLIRLLSRTPVEEAGQDLSGAKVVVAGGRGVSSKEGFLPLERLARLLGGAVGASRSAVEAGFASYSRQVGQTGRTVRPDLYIAFGISGSVQHLAGMSGSARLIAVNADPEAPIFGHADLGIVGDAVRTAEEMIRILESEAR